QAVLEAVDGRDGGRLLEAVGAPAEWVVDELAAEGEQLDLGHGDVGAGDGVAAGEVDRGRADVVGSPDVGVGDVGDVHGGGLVHAPLVQAVVLVDDDAVPHVLHAHRVEVDPGHRPHPALPRLDPQPVVRVPDHRVPHRHVRHARLRVVHAQAPDADAVSRAARNILNVDVVAPRPN
ncbi:Os05g0279850, partial [Oryza sativa Japonica Group]